jgi:hypothetical protein
MMSRLNWCACAVLVLAAAAISTAQTDLNLGDPAEMVLAVTDNGTTSAWELHYGNAREMVIRLLSEGKPALALEAAKAQFTLCPLDDLSTKAAIESVQQAITAVDGNDVRAKAFGEFARLGPAGADGQAGTADDLLDPLKDVKVTVLKKDRAYYDDYDKAIDARAAVSGTWETRWYDTEKAYARLDGGEFDEAFGMLAGYLADSIKYPAANSEDDDELQHNQNILDRITSGLGVAYRAKTGTMCGAKDFIQACVKYARFGPAGEDGWMETPDDLRPPM